MRTYAHAEYEIPEEPFRKAWSRALHLKRTTYKLKGL